MSRPAPESFLQKIDRRAQRTKSTLCVGLDPDFDKIPDALRHDRDWLLRFCSEIIEATHPYALAYKLNFAFFEAAGAEGWRVLEKVRSRIPAGCLAVADAKRGDIGNSARLYAKAILEEMAFDAVTVNPYMGVDTCEPFLTNPAQGAFFLCLTSNPGSANLQRLSSGGKAIFEHVIEMVRGLNTNRNCGLVAGATHESELRSIRAAAPDMPLLIPGVGAQGGDLDKTLEAAAGGLCLINSSRNILYASRGADFAAAAAKVAAEMQRRMALQFDD